jgi:outer membrane immunogenic protein
VREFVLIATLLSAAPAGAADLIPAMPSSVPVTPLLTSPVSAYNWTGIYLGANAGYGFGQVSGSTLGLDATLADLSGTIAGGQIGYNFQSGNLVVGVEADGQWTNLESTSSAFGGTLKTSIPWLATLRGRVGYAWNNVLLYTTVGGVYGQFDSAIDMGGFTVTTSDRNWGVTAGIGAEVGWGAWSAKAEYLYIRSLDQAYQFFGVPYRVEIHTLRAGVNYRFF